MSERQFSFSSTDESNIHPSPHSEGSSMASDKGIQLTIQNLQNEQERVQKKTFTNWMNTYLCKRNPPIKVENLFDEVKDGVVLLSLLEVLSGEKLPMEKGAKLRRPHHLANISTALNFLEKKKLKLVNINATSIADGKPAIVLGLVWTIILHFQIEETINSAPASDEEPKKKAPLAKRGLLDWAENVLSKNYGLHVKDFGKSWTDGVAFNAMIHNIRPDLVDMDQIQMQQARVNLEHAFTTAETELGIPRLLDPEDVDVEKPDEKSIMTYVAQFLKAYPGGASGVPGTNIETAEKEMKAYNSLMNWLNNEAREILATTLEPVTDRESEFMDYLGFKTELDRREPLFNKLGDKVLSGRALRLTESEWEKLYMNWQEVDDQAQEWLKKLDASLPGKLGILSQWLYDSHKLLNKQEETTENFEEMVAMYAELLKHHNEFFKDLEEWKQLLVQIKQAGRYEGMPLHGPQFDHLSKRLDIVGLQSTARQNRLEFNLTKYHLLASLLKADEKLQKWTAKYGNQDSVEDMLADYTDFVDRQNLYENFERTLSEMRKAVEIYKIGGADKSEIPDIESFLEDAYRKWKKLSVEIKSVPAMLEKIIDSWKRYSKSADVLSKWLAQGDQIMMQSLEEKEEYFKDVAQYDEEHQILNESANFLIDVSNEQTATEIRETLKTLNSFYASLVDSYHSFHNNEVIGKARAEYDKGVISLENWLADSTDILDRWVKCIHPDLKAYLLELDQHSSQIQEVENNFKVTTRTAQSLVKDSSPEDVSAMLETLNVQKEAIMMLRREIPERMKYLKALLPNVESLETGILDQQIWLEEGESLLKSHKIDGTPEETDVRLEKHKAFFTEITYQKSILESKNKVFQKIVGTKTKLKNVDFKPAEELMSSANERFQNLLTRAKDWERKLESFARLWRSLQQKQQEIEEWLDTAQSILEDDDGNPDSLIHKHKMFFGQINKQLMTEYESIANEILEQLQPSDKKHVLQELNFLKEKWEHNLLLAPIRLIKLEFVLPEDEFVQSVEAAEVALTQQENQLKSNQNVKEALAKHRQMFQEGNLISSCEQWLDQMQNLAEQLLKLNRNEQTLYERHKNHLERWKKLQRNSSDIYHQLKQLPERWKDYNEKMSGFNAWVQNVEGLLKDLSQENLTNEEYKERLAKFQKEMKNLSKYENNIKLLEQCLEELINDAPDSDSRKEQDRLQEILDRFKKLKPNMESAADKSGVLSKGYDYKDIIDKKLAWLDEAYRLTTDHRPIDSLEDARAHLSEHEMLLNKLDIEKPNITAEIESGKHLQKEKDAPAFIQQSLADLSTKWKDTNDLVKAKHEQLKNQVKDWENYVDEKASLLTCVKKAEDELERPLDTLNLDNAKKDLQSKKELQKSVNSLQGSLENVTKLSAVLAVVASPESQAQMRDEDSDFNKRLNNVSHCLNSKLADLETTVDKWTEFYNKLNNFTDWVTEMESKLCEIDDNKHDSLQVQLQKTEEISDQVNKKHATLENLEQDARELTQNFRSRESATLKSKLADVGRQWESLCTRAKNKNTGLSGNLVHWQMYQALHEQLTPWMLKAERYCATDLPKCSSLVEAKNFHSQHQVFLKECEENQLIFDEMKTEAGFLMDQPKIHHDLDDLQRKWVIIKAQSQDRTHKINMMLGAWSSYDKELGIFQEKLDKIQVKLSNEPNVNTSDVQVLEHELVMAKKIQDEVNGFQQQLNLLNDQFEQVRPHASPDGLKALKSKQESVNSSWKDVNNVVVKNQKMLEKAMQERKDFYDCLEDTEKWVKNMQKKLDSGSEIYLDEVANIQTNLKTLNNECRSQEKMFKDLQKEFSELKAACSPEEGAMLGGRFDKLMQHYTQAEDLIGNREDLCGRLSEYIDAHKDVQAKIKVLQARLASPDITEEEVARTKHELEALQKSIQPWSKDAGSLDSLIATVKMVIKDRATQRTLHFGSDLEALRNLCAAASAMATQKEAHFEEMTNLSSEFSQKKNQLVGNLNLVKEKLTATEVGKSSLKELKDQVQQIQDIRDSLYTHNPEYEHLRELGRQITSSDPKHAADIQQQFNQVNSDWEAVHTVMADKQQLYSGLVGNWEQYNESKKLITSKIADVNPLVSQEIAFTTLADLKKLQDQHKKAEFELHANQSHLDHMNIKGVQLLEDLKKLPSFDPSGMERDLDDVNLNWETTNAVIEQHKNNLETQIACWQQVQSNLDEVGNWVKLAANKLDDSLKHLDDTVSAESRLRKFKDEVPYYEELMSEVNMKIKDLADFNKNKSSHSLISAQKDIQTQIEKTVSTANQLESLLSTVSSEQQSLQKDISDKTEWMNKIKNDLSKCDDVSGNSEDLLQRYQALKCLQQELASQEQMISAVHNKSASLQKKYPSSEMSSLTKDSLAVTKRFESLKQRADHIHDSLLGQLEQHCTEAQQQLVRWLNATKERIIWCGDTAVDHYSVETKLATIKELEACFQEGEEKKQEALYQLNTIKGVLPKAKQLELEASHKSLENEWQNLIKLAQQTKNTVERSMELWQHYDHLSETLTLWLKDCEVKMNSESNLKPDLAGKKEQLELLKALDHTIQSHNTEFEDIKNTAQQINLVSHDSRTILHAGQVVNRYQNIASAVKDLMAKCGQNISDHDNYVSKHKAALDWLAKAKEDLQQCSEFGDQDSLNERLTVAKNLLIHKDEGFAFINAAIESGEKLYPNTSVKGREIIRQELRSLQDIWEKYSDNLSKTQRQLDSNKTQWLAFESDYDQQNKWLLKMESGLDVDTEFKATLAEKRALLQQYKASHQEILSHQRLIDSVSERGTALSSTQVQNNLRQLTSKYHHLCNVAENCWKKADDYVNEHQQYEESYQQCRQWIKATKDKADLCLGHDGDKQTLQSRLERLQNLVGNLREGDDKVKSTYRQGEMTLHHTSSQGQATIRSELNSLSSEWDTLVASINDNQQGLIQAIKAVELYDGSSETLQRWIQDVELQFRDCDLKATVRDKKNQVQTLKSLQEEINSKQDQFSHLQNLATQIQPTNIRLTSYSSQLTDKYAALKNLAQDMIAKWQNYVDEHCTFSENYDQCLTWMDTLRRRLQVCADLAGDKPDVEERILKLQELSAERDKGANRVHQTIESGEHLYSSTSSAGRDSIHENIRTLRDLWESICDDVSEIQRKLDINLSQWSSYDENFEVFQKWLLDTEVKLKEESDLHDTLPEKKAHLQKHKILHQDVLSRKHTIDHLTEQAHAITQSAPSAKVKKFVGELSRKYNTVCDMSKNIMDGLECSMYDHQQYQDAAQNFTDLLNSARSRLEACADLSDDKISLKAKRHRIQEIISGIKDGDDKLSVIQKLGVKTTKNTSPLGRGTLQQEIDLLQKEWDAYLTLLKHTEKSLDQTIVMWEEYESKYQEFSEWLKSMEQNVKSHELKNTCKEKQKQVEEFKKLQDEILAEQSQADRFADETRNLIHVSSDVRLSTQVSQLTSKYQGLISLVEDLITKWEGYAHEHHLYDKCMEDFMGWLAMANQRLQQCTQLVDDLDSVERMRTMLQVLTSEKESGHHKLKSLVEAGEKLYSETAAVGREKIRGEVFAAKQDWENLQSNLNDAQHRVDSYLSQLSSFTDGQGHILKWMTETEAALRADSELKNTLQEKAQKLQTCRNIFQDITSQKREVDSVLEQAQSIIQSTASCKISDFIVNTRARYEDLCANARNVIQQSEQIYSVHQKYQDSLHAAADWLTLMKDKRALCADTMGDRHTIQIKIERLDELITLMPEGASKLKDCEDKAHITMDTTGTKGCQNIQSELNTLHSDWEAHSSTLSSLKETLNQAVHYWNLHESNYNQIASWLKSMETQIKEHPLKSTLEEKEQQLASYQVFMQEIRDRHKEVDKFTEEMQTLHHLTSEPRVSNLASQLTSKFQGLLASGKELIQSCEQNVKNHQSFKTMFTESSQWLEKARRKLSECSEGGTSREELESRLDKVQSIVQEHDAATAKLTQCFEMGEKLYLNTAKEGREFIRQDLFKLKHGYESLLDDALTVQRKLEMSLVNWTSFDEDCNQAEQWLRHMETQLENQIPVRDTLSEKKSQLLNYKTFEQNVLNFQMVIENIKDKASNLIQTSRDSELAQFLSKTDSRYMKLCTTAKEQVSIYDSFVKEHQLYSDLYNSCVEWLNIIRGKLSACSDISGGQQAIQSQLDKIQDIMTAKINGEPKVNQVLELSVKILPHTAKLGKEAISRETHALREDWEAFSSALSKAKNDLEGCMTLWTNFES